MSKPPKMPEANQRTAWGWEDEDGAPEDFIEKALDVIYAEVERRREFVWRDGWRAVCGRCHTSCTVCHEEDLDATMRSMRNHILLGWRDMEVTRWTHSEGQAFSRSERVRKSLVRLMISGARRLRYRHKQRRSAPL